MEHTSYFEADESDAVARLVARRGLVATSIAPVDSVPEGAGLQRMPTRRASLRERDPMLHRIRLMAIGVLIGVVLCLGVVFVLRAREHLTRTDIAPTLPAVPAGAPNP